jgi:hypothetical protein
MMQDRKTKLQKLEIEENFNSCATMGEDVILILM